MTSLLYRREWRNYRWRQFVFWTAFLTFWALGVFAAWEPTRPYIPGVLVLGALAFAVGTHYRLRKWPCPRCGEPYFYTAWYWWSFSRRSCAHCGLNRDTAS